MVCAPLTHQTRRSHRGESKAAQMPNTRQTVIKAKKFHRKLSITKNQAFDLFFLLSNALHPDMVPIHVMPWFTLLIIAVRSQHWNPFLRLHRTSLDVGLTFLFGLFLG